MQIVEIDLDDIRTEFLELIFNDITNPELTNDEICIRTATLQMAMSRIESLDFKAK